MQASCCRHCTQCLKLHAAPLRAGVALLHASGTPTRRCSTKAGAGPPEGVAMGWMWQTSKTTASSSVADLRQDRIKAKKSLGQNFLTDDVILADIVSASGIKSGDLVIEVGPGTGNLTRHLLAAGARITAVEKDDTLVERLRTEFSGAANLRLVHGDVLRVGVAGIIQGMLQQGRDGADAAASGTAGADEAAASAASTSGGATASGAAGSSNSAGPQQPLPKVKVVANLPYNITKEFLKAMLPMGDHVSELSIMIQEEVARRLVNKKPGLPDYRAMNIYVHYHSRPKYRFLIPKEKYYPAPGVDGALVTFVLNPPGARTSVPSEKGFLSIAARSFSSRRKMMRNNLQPLYSSSQVERALAQAGLRPDARAQDLSVSDFAKFHWRLHELLLEEELGPADKAGEGDYLAAMDL